MPASKGTSPSQLSHSHPLSLKGSASPGLTRAWIQVHDLSRLICRALGAARAAADEDNPPIVGLFLGTSIACIIAMLASLRVRYCLSIDPSSPLSRYCFATAIDQDSCAMG